MTVLKWALVATLAVALFGCASEGNDEASPAQVTPEQEEPEPTSEPEPTPEPTPEPKPELLVRVNGPSQTTQDAVTIRGTVSLDNAKIRVKGATEVRVKGKRWAADVPIRAMGRNSYRIVATKKGAITGREAAVVVRRQSAEERAAEEAERIAALTQTFSGNGTLNLGNINVKVESVLEWTNANPDFPDLLYFSVHDEDFDLFLQSQAESGRSVVPAGRYRKVEVAGEQWTITIRPR